MDGFQLEFTPFNHCPCSGSYLRKDQPCDFREFGKSPQSPKCCSLSARGHYLLCVSWGKHESDNSIQKGSGQPQSRSNVRQRSAHFLKQACGLSRFSRVRLCDPMTCSPQGSSAHGILSAGSHATLQGMSPTPGLNPCLLCLLLWQEGSLPLAPSEKPKASLGTKN